MSRILLINALIFSYLIYSLYLQYKLQYEEHKNVSILPQKWREREIFKM